MSWYSRSQPEKINPLSHKNTFTELKKVDPRTLQTFTHYISEEQPQNLSKYSDWSRVKVESINTITLSKHLRDNKQHYNDPDFPHNNSVLTHDNYEKHFKWLRVARVVENAVYSRKADDFSHQNIQLNRPALEKALLLIARAAPDVFAELKNKELHPEGLYEFKIFRGGYIQNVVIDDYIPVHENMPIFVGPTGMNEVYPMLIEKAIAKACGNYEDIPQNAEQILQMLFCSPVSTNLMSELRDKNTLGQKLQSALQHRQLTVLISKKQEKVRNYGINDGQVYLVIKRHEIQWGGSQLKQLQESRFSFLNQSQIFKPINYNELKSMKASKVVENKKMQKESSLNYSVSDFKNNQSSVFVNGQDRKETEPVYELISQSKISAWNGRYSLNDEVWTKIDPQKKMFLYSQINKNKSFLINESDISRLFEQVLIFESSQTNNKDWISMESQSGRPSFTRFTSTRNDNVTLRVTASIALSQTIVLVRQTGPKQYTFVASNFTPNSTQVELSTSLFPGKYILATYHQWSSARSVKCHVFIASKEHISLEKSNLSDNEFLIKAILSLQQSREKTTKQQKQECTFRMELQRLGLAYMILKPANTKQKQFTLKIDQSRLQKEQWELHEPYKGLNEVTASDHLNKGQTLLVLSKVRVDLSKKYYFPLSAFAVKK